MYINPASISPTNIRGSNATENKIDTIPHAALIEKISNFPKININKTINNNSSIFIPLSFFTKHNSSLRGMYVDHVSFSFDSEQRFHIPSLYI